jgi:uncharacterized protein (TIGR03905 family)
MKYSYTPSGVCSRQINIELDENTEKIISAQFVGGCNGNTKGISALVEGMDKDEVISRLSKIKCGMKDSSCPAELAKALASIK